MRHRAHLIGENDIGDVVVEDWWAVRFILVSWIHLERGTNMLEHCGAKNSYVFVVEEAMTEFELEGTTEELEKILKSRLSQPSLDILH